MRQTYQRKCNPDLHFGLTSILVCVTQTSTSYTARERECEYVRLRAKEIQGSRHVWLRALQSLFSCQWPSVAQQPCRSCRRAPAHCSRCLSGISFLSSRDFASSGSLRKSPACRSRCLHPTTTAGCWVVFVFFLFWAPEYKFYT